MMKQYEKFDFFNIDELNEKMENQYYDYEIISITKGNNEEVGDFQIAWLKTRS